MFGPVLLDHDVSPAFHPVDDPQAERGVTDEDLHIPGNRGTRGGCGVGVGFVALVRVRALVQVGALVRVGALVGVGALVVALVGVAVPLEPIVLFLAVVPVSIILLLSFVSVPLYSLVPF